MCAPIRAPSSESDFGFRSTEAELGVGVGARSRSQTSELGARSRSQTSEHGARIATRIGRPLPSPPSPAPHWEPARVGPKPARPGQGPRRHQSAIDPAIGCRATDRQPSESTVRVSRPSRPSESAGRVDRPSQPAESAGPPDRCARQPALEWRDPAGPRLGARSRGRLMDGVRSAGWGSIGRIGFDRPDGVRSAG